MFFVLNLHVFFKANTLYNNSQSVRQKKVALIVRNVISEKYVCPFSIYFTRNTNKGLKIILP